MTNRNDLFLPVRIAAATALALVSVTLSGCEGEPPPPPPAPKPAPKAEVAKPIFSPISELMTKLNIDERVRWPEERASTTLNDKEREAVLTFFDTFARGDSSRLQPMLAATDQYELDALVKNGQWEPTTKSISKIDLRTGRTPGGPSSNSPCVLAIYTVGDELEPQLWTYRMLSSGPEFEAVATPPGIMNQLSGDDWIGAWFALLAKDQEIASKPDETPRMPQSNLAKNNENNETSTVSDAPGTAQPPTGPGGPGSPSKRPPGPPQKPNRPGFGQ